MTRPSSFIYIYGKWQDDFIFRGISLQITRSPWLTSDWCWSSWWAEHIAATTPGRVLGRCITTCMAWKEWAKNCEEVLGIWWSDGEQQDVNGKIWSCNNINDEIVSLSFCCCCIFNDGQTMRSCHCFYNYWPLKRFLTPPSHLTFEPQCVYTPTSWCCTWVWLLPPGAEGSSRMFWLALTLCFSSSLKRWSCWGWRYATSGLNIFQNI